MYQTKLHSVNSLAKNNWLWLNGGMKRTTALELLGGTVASAAKAIGVTTQAVYAWDEELAPAIADRVIAAYARRFPSPEITELLRRIETESTAQTSGA